MLETRAIVVRTDGRSALVQVNQGNGCGECNGKGCGAGKLSQLFCSKPRQFKVENPIEAGVGDEVIVSVAEGAVMRGISLVYALPLLLMIAGAVLGEIVTEHLSQRDVYAAAGSLLGLVVGFGLAKWFSTRQNGSFYKPYIARQLLKE